MASTYHLSYALEMLRKAIDFAEIEGDFKPLRKWMHEAELSAADELVAPAPVYSLEQTKPVEVVLCP